MVRSPSSAPRTRFLTAGNARTQLEDELNLIRRLGTRGVPIVDDVTGAGGDGAGGCGIGVHSRTRLESCPSQPSIWVRTWSPSGRPGDATAARSVRDTATGDPAPADRRWYRCEPTTPPPVHRRPRHPAPLQARTGRQQSSTYPASWSWQCPNSGERPRNFPHANKSTLPGESAKAKSSA
jgi:hypothetical protein